SPGDRWPRTTDQPPTRSTAPVATPTRTSVLRSSAAESRVALTPSLSSWLFEAAKVCSSRSASEYAWTTLIAPGDSPAAPARSPSRRRCTREAEVILRVDREEDIAKKGKAARTTSARRQSRTNMTTSIATSVKTLPRSGIAAVVATSRRQIGRAARREGGSRYAEP